ncbi:PIG-L family deacetylase [Moheibacter sediminis]|uniref:N-acetylglucosaminyl deacetylase, LmbE family n=1 Tax=Moheibacter sediminis TaxID=1434700 RepID=A0A1W1YJT5_9FLAO|nr:PIG-L family deacetylase [Moheibacter sediminis]SMC36051.1 N-acetylglucosaminyl deacetylase, LmbE family [Moheibacter sediminis]
MRKFFYFLFFLITISNFAQSPKKTNSSEIYESIQKLNFLGSVLYVAAHPDDENTHLISYFANDVHARTAYISLTRGDGGQNLIGPELRELLGVIRTQELMQARKIDGGIQYFSRANDFGFSKHPDETFEIWDKEQVLSDLVYVIRQFQPDIIINRFDHRSPGTTHGHHTGSAMLSVEAFDIANDKTKFPEHLNQYSTWSPKRLFFNQSWFFYGSQEKFDQADKSKLFQLDIGSYYPTLGLSNSEIAAKSRSQHSSQGFGATPERGVDLEYLEIVKGTQPQKDVFEGIDTSWNRVRGGKEIGEILSKVEKEFEFKNPSKSVPELIKAYQLIQKLEDKHWREIKSEEIKNIIVSCAGLYLEVVSSSTTAVAGENLKFNLEAINRSELSIKLNSVKVNDKTISVDSNLTNNKILKSENSFQIPDNKIPTTPYWLNEKGSLGMYKVSDGELIGLPETPDAFSVKFNLSIENQQFEILRPLVYKINDPTKGETYKPFVIVPKAIVNVEEKVLIFADERPQKVAVKVKSFTENLKGNLSLKAAGWKISPGNQEISLNVKGEEKIFWFEVSPPENQSETELIPQLKIGNEIFDKQMFELNYEHIPEQKILLPGGSKLVHIDIQKKGEKIGYIIGAGDSVPENLRQIGYDVQIISPQNITTENLKDYDAIVLGIRAFNVIPELKFKNQILFDYVKNGGNLIVQYNTSRDVFTEEIAPFPLILSRDRVTDENSEVKFLNENHPALNFPNKITSKDFTGWNQERGLYFPSDWSKEFVPLLSMHDKGESAMKGSLLVAKYGKGNYVYTGLSFFRLLPEGVPGAYRLFANLLSLGK